MSRINESKNAFVESGTIDINTFGWCAFHVRTFLTPRRFSLELKTIRILTQQKFFVSWDKNFCRNFQLISIKTHATTISKVKCLQTILRMNSYNSTVIWLYNMFIIKLNICVQRLENKPTCFSFCYCQRRQNVFDKQFPCAKSKKEL